MIISYYHPPKKDYSSILCSFLIHCSLLIIFMVILLASNSKKTINLNVKNQGALAVNIVPDVNQSSHNNIQVKQQFLPQKNLTDKNFLKKNQSAVSHNTPVNTSSGGEGIQGSEILPVLNNQKLLKYKAPSYPARALRQRQQGTVVVRLLVNNKQILGNTLYKSSGYALLDNAVLNVVKFWQLQQDVHQKAWLEVKVNFILR